MDTQARFTELESAGTTTEEALALYDALDVVLLDELWGRWKGSGFHTGHPMDGILEAYRWYGKEFIDPERVHPLIFSAPDGSTFLVDPRRMPLGLATRFPVPRSPAVAQLFQASRFLLTTDEPRARARMTEYRGKVSATMIYDDLPVLDVFRKVDRDTLLGAMDLRGLERPLFFVLRRERSPG
jgi:hypothetical protein